MIVRAIVPKELGMKIVDPEYELIRIAQDGLELVFNKVWLVVEHSIAVSLEHVDDICPVDN